MNILFLDQFSDLSGAQLCLLDLLPAVRDQGWHVWVAVPGAGPLLERARTLGAETVSLGFGPFPSGWRSPGSLLRFGVDSFRLKSRLAELIQQCRAGLVYVNGPRMIPAAAVAAHSRTPILFHAHSTVPKPFAAQLVGRSLRRARATVVASSQFVANPLRRFVPPGRIHVVDNGVEDCSRPRATTSGWTIGVIGRIAPEKGQDVFLRAAREVHQTIPGFRFVIAGAALFSAPGATRYSAELSELATGLPVEFSGWSDDVPGVLARLDLLVVPSLGSESMTRVIPEAFSAGVPVVAFDAGGIGEAVVNGRNGFLVEPSTPGALAETIRRLFAEGKGSLAALGEQARRDWMERFTRGQYQRRIVELIRLAGGSGLAEQTPEEEG